MCAGPVGCLAFPGAGDALLAGTCAVCWHRGSTHAGVGNSATVLLSMSSGAVLRTYSSQPKSTFVLGLACTAPHPAPQPSALQPSALQPSALQHLANMLGASTAALPSLPAPQPVAPAAPPRAPQPSVIQAAQPVAVLAPPQFLPTAMPNTAPQQGPLPFPEFPAPTQFVAAYVPCDLCASSTATTAADAPPDHGARPSLPLQLHAAIQAQHRVAAAARDVRRQCAAQWAELEREEAAELVRVRQLYAERRGTVQARQADALAQHTAAATATVLMDALEGWATALGTRRMEGLGAEDVQLLCLRCGALFDAGLPRVDGRELLLCDTEDAVQGALGIQGPVHASGAAQCDAGCRDWRLSTGAAGCGCGAGCAAAAARARPRC